MKFRSKFNYDFNDHGSLHSGLKSFIDKNSPGGKT